MKSLIKICQDYKDVCGVNGYLKKINGMFDKQGQLDAETCLKYSEMLSNNCLSDAFGSTVELSHTMIVKGKNDFAYLDRFESVNEYDSYKIGNKFKAVDGVKYEFFTVKDSIEYEAEKTMVDMGEELSGQIHDELRNFVNTIKFIDTKKFNTKEFLEYKSNLDRILEYCVKVGFYDVATSLIKYFSSINVSKNDVLYNVIAGYGNYQLETGKNMEKMVQQIYRDASRGKYGDNMKHVTEQVLLGGYYNASLKYGRNNKFTMKDYNSIMNVVVK